MSEEPRNDKSCYKSNICKKPCSLHITARIWLWTYFSHTVCTSILGSAWSISCGFPLSHAYIFIRLHLPISQRRQPWQSKSLNMCLKPSCVLYLSNEQSGHSSFHLHPLWQCRCTFWWNILRNNRAVTVVSYLRKSLLCAQDLFSMFSSCVTMGTGTHSGIQAFLFMVRIYHSIHETATFYYNVFLLGTKNYTV